MGEGVNNQRLTLQLIMSLPPNPHPVEVFRGALLSRGYHLGRLGWVGKALYPLNDFLAE